VRADQPDLVRGLGPLETTSLVVGGIIGVSIFLVPSAVAREVGAPWLALATWVVSGLLAICGALTYAELVAAVPETGGTYAFLRRAYRGPVAFLFGWSMFFVIAPAGMAVPATMAATYAGHFFPSLSGSPVAARMVAAGLLLGVSFINYLGVRLGGKTQNLLALLKTTALAAVIVLCFAWGRVDFEVLSTPVPAGQTSGQSLAALGTAMIMTIFSFSGWHFPTQVAGEVRDPSRTIPRAIIVGIALVLVLYLSANLAFITVLPFDRFKASERVAVDAMEAVMGSTGADLIAIAVILSAIGTLNAQILNYPRIAFAMAQDRLFFETIARVHPRHRTPSNSIAALGVLAAVYAFSGNYQAILGYFAFILQLFLTLGVAAVLVLRRREPDLPRPYRTWGYPLTPLLFIAIETWYMANLLRERLAVVSVGILIALAGIPFYLYWARRRAVT
jgi:APA family basic amino acid/polyamine antiporter